jgi:hypothetical protein
LTWSEREPGALAGIYQICHERLFTIPSTEDLFNPYGDEDADVDRSGAALERGNNLKRYLASYRDRPEVVVVAEAPGPWGCRFSGVPITSEEQLVDADFPLAGRVSGKGDLPHREYSARIFWRVMAPYFPGFIAWNAVPFHPHRVGEPMSIRTPRTSELKGFAWLTRAVLEVVEPGKVIALGRKAQYQLEHLGADCTYVRHPSQGGAVLFEEGMKRLFGAMR